MPPLRDRREDLPLLIQSYINRFCHGDRASGCRDHRQGDVGAPLQLIYHSGNLAELENIACQLCMAPPGRPVDVNLLPEKVRNGTLITTRVDSGSDLELDRLVGACEQAAIREALRRTTGNKSQAARLLEAVAQRTCD